MAIARGAGTEIIRTAMFEDIINTGQKLIIGEQHHIYTVLSVTIQCIARSGSQVGYLTLHGWDATGATTAGQVSIANISIAVGETFIWNDKFSFNGFEPLSGSMSGALTTAAEQDAIADQASAVSQYLKLETDSSSTQYDCIVSFIDQNNS